MLENTHQTAKSSKIYPKKAIRCNTDYAYLMAERANADIVPIFTILFLIEFPV
jgi:hypothetical protein